MCGAYGCSIIHISCRITRLLHFRSVSSFTQIIKEETDVLNEKRSISSSTFLMILCSAFNSALLGWSSLTAKRPSAPRSEERRVGKECGHCRRGCKCIKERHG